MIFIIFGDSLNEFYSGCKRRIFHSSASVAVGQWIDSISEEEENFISS
jgi:hypothetical protein